MREDPQLFQTVLLFYQDPYLVEEIIKEKGLTGEEKTRFRQEHAGPIWETFRAWAANTILDVPKDSLAKTEHSHPLGMVVSTHFRCGKGVKRGLKNGALPFNID